MLSRYKGDDFRGKNRELKADLVREVIERDVKTQADFYQLVGQFGEPPSAARSACPGRRLATIIPPFL
ncbi:hypothetical protein [Pseudomonas sp. OTU5201]|uniref:hypothetical protein n=1 Tax=Pseudomonas sp. OTU5201 TaxID=3043850 RepID=UPI00313D1D98